MNILITGGSSGLGRALVEKCAEQGEHILFTYNRNVGEAQNLCLKYANVEARNVDFTSKESVKQFFEEIPDFNIDVLVNNAWVGNPNGTYFHKTNPNDFFTSFTNNVLPLIQITQACISEFRKQKNGKIITILTSYLLNLPPLGFSVYCATKAYIEQLAKCWAKENIKFGITSNCVSPEYMYTSFAKVDERVIEQMEQVHPLKHLLQPDEVANVIYDIMNASQQLNGVNIPINAGQNILK